MIEGGDVCESKCPVVGHHTDGEYDVTAEREGKSGATYSHPGALEVY